MAFRVAWWINEVRFESTLHIKSLKITNRHDFLYGRVQYSMKFNCPCFKKIAFISGGYKRTNTIYYIMCFDRISFSSF